jgi:hypothetical protein
MSNALLNEVRKLQVKGPGKAVLIVLSDRADDAGKCWPSYATIASETGLAESTVRKHVPLLRNAGLLRWEERFTTCGDKDSNLYTLTLGGGPPHGPPTPPDGPQVGCHTAEGGPPRSGKASMEAPMEAKELFDLPKSPKAEIPIALPFPSEAFAEAWREWEQHRIEIKHKLRPTSTKRQLKMLAAMGEERAISTINHTIEKGWQGLVEPSAPRANGSNQQPTTSTPPGTINVNGRVFKS